MKHVSLAAKYRPQKFSELVGQEMAAAALSRAASEDRAAPAYLLSGTRGVGKTTIARIFAKALNCEHAPAPEPCNECVQCAQITSGTHVDVCEIDGASNTGVDDVRALRENVGYMPMQGRWKIFILDEAHMLSKSAFNALLKTLEEPPGRTVFIFATTEAHRFPATIVSRCQHFVFQHLTEEALHKRLMSVLDQEGAAYDPAAVRLIARRAQGSARDGLSLLDQTLALAGSQKLSADIVRQSLGLAGLEFFERLFKAIPGRSCAEIIDLSGGLLRDGVDIGFFMRELAGAWRNLFLYKQEGEKILPHLRLAPDELAFLKSAAPLYSLAHLHAAWQMTLENQRPVTMSPEPGPALELLLLNLALLPRLMPVGDAAPTPGQGLGGSAPPPRADEEPSEYGKEPDAKKKTGLSPNPADNPPKKDLWEEFRGFCASYKDGKAVPKAALHGVKARWEEGRLTLAFLSEMAERRFNETEAAFKDALENFCGGKAPALALKKASSVHAEEAAPEAGHPKVRLFMEILGGQIMPKNQENPNAQYE